MLVGRPVAVLVALVALAAPPAADALVVGIADQKPDMFTDKRFRSMEIKHARIAVPWDVMSYSWQVEELDQWMLRARQAACIRSSASATRAYIGGRCPTRRACSASSARSASATRG